MINKQEKLAVANFKMNLSASYELKHWLTNFLKAKQKARLEETKLVLCPQITYLDQFAKKIKSRQVEFGAQDCFWEQKGAFTGAVSPATLYSGGAQYVILGHSERRKYFGETDEIVAVKIEAALKASLQPIVCIGENAQEKRTGSSLRVIDQQLKKCLKDIGRGRIEKIVICYEPVWAISSNDPDHLPEMNEIMEAKLLIRKILTDQYDRRMAEKVRIIYGGSVDNKNANEVCVEPGMDGALIGKASLAPYDLIKIAEIIDGQ